MKDHRREGSRFSLAIYGFCGSIALYSASLFFFKCLLVFQIKSKCYKKLFNTDFLSSKNEEITLPHEFIFVFVWSFHWGVIVRNVLPKAWGSEKI